MKGVNVRERDQNNPEDWARTILIENIPRNWERKCFLCRCFLRVRFRVDFCFILKHCAYIEYSCEEKDNFQLHNMIRMILGILFIRMLYIKLCKKLKSQENLKPHEFL